MKNSTLLMVGILAAVAMLSAGLALVPATMQQASARIQASISNKIKVTNVVATPSVVTIVK